MGCLPPVWAGLDTEDSWAVLLHRGGGDRVLCIMCSPRGHSQCCLFFVRVANALELSSLVIFRTLKTSFRRAKLQKRRAFAQKSCRRAWAGELATMKHYALCIIYCANTLLSSDNIRTKGQAVGIVHCEICIIYCALFIVHLVLSIVHCPLCMHCPL